MRVANKDSSSYVRNRDVFTGSNMYARWERTSNDSDVYVVYSYGTHWIHALYDHDSKQWFENNEKYSRSTSMQASYVRRGLPPDVTQCSNEVLQSIRDLGYTGYVAKRLSNKTTK